jgi:hypothetical protein
VLTLADAMPRSFGNRVLLRADKFQPSLHNVLFVVRLIPPNESSSPTAGGGSGGAQPKGTNEK